MALGIIHIEETDSTNNWLKARDSDADTIVWADHQTAGRGSGTNSWESEKGANLLFSMLIHPQQLLAAQQFRISMAMSLALVRTLKPIAGEGISIKWPNDIYWHDRKLCGMLIENSISGAAVRSSIIGVGLNVNQQTFISDAPNPVSLRNITGVCHDRAQLLHSVADAFTLSVDPSDYRRQLYRREGFFKYRDADGTFVAEMLDVEDDGRLVLRDDGGRVHRYGFKEVTFVL